MPNAETKRIQELGVRRLTQIFPTNINNMEVRVEKEWTPFSKVDYPGMSSPILDIAIGPFATEERQIDQYNDMLKRHDIGRFLDAATKFHFQNLDKYNIPREWVGLDDFRGTNFTNRNPRCFLAVEIEGREDRKVVLSDIFNTSAMGRIGLIVAKTEKVLAIFVRLLYYSWFLKKSWKTSIDTK